MAEKSTDNAWSVTLVFVGEILRRFGSEELSGVVLVATGCEACAELGRCCWELAVDVRPWTKFTL